MSPCLIAAELIDRLDALIGHFGAGPVRDELERVRAKADASPPKSFPRWRATVDAVLAEAELGPEGVPAAAWASWRHPWPELDPPATDEDAG